MGDTTTEVDLSPYAEDGVPADPVSLEIRVPLVDAHRQRWNYITAVMVSDWPWKGLRPTDDELRMIGSFHEEYLTYWYGPPGTGWRARDLDTRPFDIDGGANGITFVKHEHGGFGYRRRTWEYGPTFVPGPRDEPSGLLAVLDRTHSLGGELAPRWVKWKAEHPETFGGGSDVQ